MTFNQPMGITARTARYRQVIEPLQYIHLDDFSPGIYDDWQSNSGAQSAPDGAAQLTGTYSCVSSPSGGLMPAPRLVNSIWESPVDSFVSHPDPHYPATDQVMRIMAMRVFGPVNSTQTDYPDMVCVIYSWFYDPAGTGVFTNTRAKTLFRIHNVGSGSIYDVATSTAATNILSAPAYGPAWIDFSRAYNAAPAITIGNPCVSFVKCDISSTGSTGSMQRVYPAQATPTANSSDNLAAMFTATSTIPEWVFGHQDRFVFLSGSGREISFGSYTTSGETVQFTNPNNYSVLSAKTVYVADNPTGFGSFFSMNASSALFIKRTGGAYVISGALETPTITRLPGVPSADPPNNGTILPNGSYVYGGRQGVWAWNGGDNAQMLSPQLRPGFWIPDNIADVTRYVNPPIFGSFASSYPYIFCPNSFLMDVRSGGWWKLTNTYDFIFNERSSTGKVICSPNTIQSIEQDYVAHYYDTNLGATSYSWTSQPLKRSIGRYLHFEDFNIVAQGHGTITAAFVGLSGEPAQTPITFDINTTDRPILLNFPISIIASDVSIVLTSTAYFDGVTPAPRIYRISLGYLEREHAR